MEDIVVYLIGASGLIAGVVFWLQAKTEERAAPARAKAPEDRTLADKLAIEADARVDALDVQRLEGFAADFVAAHLDLLLKTVPGGGLLSTAGDMAAKALNAYQKANPKVAARQAPTLEVMARKLAGAMGKKDVLAEALREAIGTERP